ncbi:protein SIEL isoform X2 [Nicotiana sylvestris]|uniref:Protein SIEL isoform X2 n=2 Tax=Nicotiana TaxID=4085 RepID=A0A1S3XWN2_TOBAC|nr:PREDICTED: uncharacterized protein LOC104222546 isoform X2 [Nicotiana sylvestris]XP_016444348.1 PREDICTED: protein SIEL-like isoform X2 [Nicotiana tabacum]
MEHHLRRNLEINENIRPQALLQALSLIVNPSTSDSTLSSILKTLTLSLKNPNTNPFLSHHILRLFSLLFHHRLQLPHNLISTVREFSLLPSTSARSLADSLACLSISDINVNDESTFLSLVLRPCISVRHWLLLNASKFDIRPSVLLTVLLGFTKDPYPYIRGVALDGLAELCKCIVVEDESLIHGCYFRAVEFLFDSEDSVRCSAVRAVSACGQLIVASKQERSKRDWSDALFLQLCSMVRDMSVKVRIEVFSALGKIEIVSEYILLQTLSKKASSATKEMNFPGQYADKIFRIPASSASFAFLHGLEDEFSEVRESACRALQTLAILSADFTNEVVNFLMDVLNDDSTAVRLQALDTMHHVAMVGQLKVQQAHLHMFLGILLDSHSLIRCTARKVLKLTELPSLAMFKMCVDGLIRDFELYPQDETEVFSALFMVGQNHGKFLVSLINEVSQMVEPSSGGKLGYDNARKASYLVLATSAPVSMKQQTCSIPPRIFSYAVTLLGRITRSLAEIVDQRTLLTYLSYCSRFTFVSASEFFKVEKHLEGCDVQLIQRCEVISNYHIRRKLQLKEAESSLLDFQVEQNKEINCVNIILQAVIDIWPSLKLGLIDEVTRTLRNLKAELAMISDNNHSGELVFALLYIDALERLGHLCSHLMFSKEFYCHKWGKLDCSLGKLDRCLRDMSLCRQDYSKEITFCDVLY